MQPHIINTGIDTIKVNVKLVDPDGNLLETQVLPNELATMLDVWQEQARANTSPVATSYSFHDARLVMLPNAASAWKYILKNDCLNISLAPRLKIAMIAKVTLSSSYLWEVGNISKAIDEVHDLLITLFGPHLALQTAQIDLCIDLVGWKPPTDWKRMFITHAIRKRDIGESQKEQEYYRGNTLETVLMSGHGCPVSCKIYDKRKEIIQHGNKKTWFYAPWKDNGWNGEDEVWRLEFSIERAGLHDMKLEDIYDTLRNIKRIWAYCTRDWLRMVVHEPTKNRTRWGTHPVWLQFQKAFDTYGDMTLDGLGPLVRKRNREANIEQGVAAVAGYMTTLAAWDDELPDDADPDEIFNMVIDRVRTRWHKLNIVPQDLVREKKFIYSQKA